MTKAQQIKVELEEARSAFNKAWVEDKRFDEDLFRHGAAAGKGTRRRVPGRGPSD